MISEQDYIQALKTIEAYHRQIEAALNTVATSQPPKTYPLLKDCDLPTRIYNILKSGMDNFKTKTVWDLAQLPRKYFWGYRNYGKWSHTQLELLLAKHGLHFAR